MKNQTNEICLAAVRHSNSVLLYKKSRPIEEYRSEISDVFGEPLKYVKKQTHQICLEAVTYNGHALEYVKKQTPEICLAAVKQNGYALKFVKNQTPEICLEAVKENDFAFLYIRDANLRKEMSQDYK